MVELNTCNLSDFMQYRADTMLYLPTDYTEISVADNNFLVKAAATDI